MLCTVPLYAFFCMVFVVLDVCMVFLFCVFVGCGVLLCVVLSCGVLVWCFFEYGVLYGFVYGAFVWCVFVRCFLCMVLLYGVCLFVCFFCTGLLYGDLSYGV